MYGDPNKDVLLAQTDSYAVNELTNALASVNAFDMLVLYVFIQERS